MNPLLYNNFETDHRFQVYLTIPSKSFSSADEKLPVKCKKVIIANCNNCLQKPFKCAIIYF